MPCPHIFWDIFHLAGSLPETALVAPDQSSAWPTRCQSSGFSPAKSFVDVLVGTAPPRMILPLFTRVEKPSQVVGLRISFLSTVSCPCSTKTTYFEGEFSSLPGISYQPKVALHKRIGPVCPNLGQVIGKSSNHLIQRRWLGADDLILVCCILFATCKS